MYVHLTNVSVQKHGVSYTFFQRLKPKVLSVEYFRGNTITIMAASGVFKTCDYIWREPAERKSPTNCSAQLLG